MPGLLKTARTEKQRLNISTILTIVPALGLNTKVAPNILSYMPKKISNSLDVYSRSYGLNTETLFRKPEV